MRQRGETMNLYACFFLVSFGFGLFLCLEYLVFFVLILMQRELKKNVLSVFLTAFLGIFIASAGILGSLRISAGGHFGFFLTKLEFLTGVIGFSAYILFLRNTLIAIKDSIFVETDDYKSISKKYVIVFLSFSTAIVFLVLVSDHLKIFFHTNERILAAIFMGYLILAAIIENINFLRVFSRESGKLNPLNQARYRIVIICGMAAVILVSLDIFYFISGQSPVFSKTVPLYSLGLIFLALGLGLNLVFEYSDVLSRAYESNKKLTELNRQMMDDVRTAQSLQISLLPLEKQKAIQNYLDMEISYMPMQSVGGDYYDYYKLDEKTFLILLGDASGHGVYAAMIWAMLKVEVEEMIEEKIFNDLSQTFTLLNQRITKILENTYSYATLFACLIHIENKTVSYISAGHTDQLYYSAREKAVNRIKNKNPIIGTFRNAKFSADTITYQNGDAILMFSDGIIEGANPEGEQFGKERLENIFLEVKKEDSSASDMIGNILFRLEDFFEGAPQKDDRTILVIKL